jgi:ubiquinone/menaquinone biosynthesis C-methylase UbiE
MSAPTRLDTSTGSYRPEGDGWGLEGELSRLEAQAALSWEEEHLLLRRLGLDGGGRVVDLGCGPGAFAARVLEAFPRCRVVGVELDDRLAAAAGRRLATEPRFRIVRTSATTTGLASSAFDVVITRLLAQHLVRPAAMLQEAIRLLGPGGMVIVIDVDMELWGVASPSVPELELIHARASMVQHDRGGDRTVGRRLYRMLVDAGFEAPRLELFAYHSDRLGLEPFAVQLDPARLIGAVEKGAITFAEYTSARLEYQRFLADPDAFVMLTGFLAHGRKPDRGSTKETVP